MKRFATLRATVALPLITLSLSGLLGGSPAFAQSFKVTDESGAPLATVMVTQLPAETTSLELDDHGYPTHGKLNQAPVEITRFTNGAGAVDFSSSHSQWPAAVKYRLRKPGYYDQVLTSVSAAQSVSLKKIEDAQDLARQKPSNVWLSQLDFAGDAELKKRFLLNCAFCHQQGSEFMRAERSADEWLQIIERMNGYGARLPDEDQQLVAELLSSGYRDLRQKATELPQALAWDQDLAKVEITEWPIGDSFSQQHDFIIHPNGMVYVGDNLQDRIYEVNPETGEYTVYVVPHEETDTVGGFMGNRFKTFPKVANYYGVHSFAISPTDGNLFITPSMTQSLLEFDVDTKEFKVHPLSEGYYPHTIRADEQDRIWFTLAVSSQVGMLDRRTGEFRFYDLPARSVKEWAVIKAMPLIFSFAPENRPMPSIDKFSTGLPMPYGIDIAPDGRVWVGRLYGNDIGVIDPQDHSVKMIETPFNGPRRLRIDAAGNLWIVAFQDSQLVKYDPAADRFTHYDLPVMNEVPYALNVDKERNVVWVNGNQSDTVLSFDIDSESWKVFPMPRKRTFTRDVEIESNGDVFTSNSHFPSWQIEDGQPTLIRIRQLDSE